MANTGWYSCSVPSFQTRIFSVRRSPWYATEGIPLSALTNGPINGFAAAGLDKNRPIFSGLNGLETLKVGPDENRRSTSVSGDSPM